MKTILKFLAALALTGAMISTSSADQLLRPRMNLGKGYVKTISGDRGGYVIDYAIRMLKMRRSGGFVRFNGACDSACTLYLAMPKSKVCVTRNASFGFHLPYGAGVRGNQVAADFMMKNYPGWVRGWIAKRGGLKNSVTTMTYADASRFLPTCPAEQRSTIASLSPTRLRGG
ncbi:MULTISPECIES: hypothetical protein [unclassified Mesorhizobium]|uniref:hypothetical protein n=1 Tax=unclassified Mesorhizobium TaxID=325217 RepID=UPI000A5F0F07|nr:MULTISPECIES: hypothetical protein [unclassified Mesorhizobium]WIE90566.1 hypothetical protein P9270_023970 [Mesorhizobium sp. WSM4875]MDG4854831.1 hypothetical protein [Mesorhizobium sp. WSM4982]MDG4900778.1 hypothetical protein [Mesorhizobium sp. WSM4962]MDG4910306.1 hypothetical protein [Mesorhizobium sp. WSM4898]MDG4914052.1 hypothetical protein [Mesorhizobium sp. WSM4983]